LENFRTPLGKVYAVEAQDGYRRLDAHFTREEWGPVKKLIDILGLQVQTVLAVACAHVLREVPSVRADWRRRMRTDCERYHEVLRARAARAQELAAKYDGGGVGKGAGRRRRSSVLTMRGQITAAVGPGKYADRTEERPTGRPVAEWLPSEPGLADR
jgi:hypothetical protein